MKTQGFRRYLFVGIAVLAGLAELLALLRARHRYGPGLR